MSAPSSTKGRIRNILETIYGYVDSALTADYASYEVSQADRPKIYEADVFPFAAVRVNPVEIFDLTYGRRIPSAGSQAVYEFSIHVFHLRNTGSGEDHNRDVTIAARRIIDYIVDKSQDTTEMAVNGIHFIRDVFGRESDPRGRRLARIIIEGVVEVNREDSP